MPLLVRLPLVEGHTIQPWRFLGALNRVYVLLVLLNSLVALSGLVVLVHGAPTDPYFADSLQGWEQGRFVRFHGVAQWLGWLWPYAAIAWLLVRAGRR